MRIWVTGCGGFLASHICDALIAEGHEVAGNDNLLCGDANNVPLAVKFFYTDCRKFDALKWDMEKFAPDVVVHCAATAHEGASSFSPSFITQNIYEASVATFSAAIASGAKRIVYTTSMARYGAQEPPFHEDMRPAPVDPYGVAKVAAEDTLKILAKTHGIQWAIAVPHNIIGVRQRYVDPMRNVASIMMNRSLQGKPIIIYGDGLQTRCFSPVKDCIPSLVKMVYGFGDSEIINIGPDKGEITILELADHVKHLTGNTHEHLFMAGRPNEVKHAHTCSDKARKILGYTEQQTLDICLKEMIAAILNNGAKPFVYDFPIELPIGCPKTWTEQLI